MFANLKFKDDRTLLAFAALLVVCATILVALGKVTWQEALPVVAGSLFFPGLLGKGPSTPPSGAATVPPAAPPARKGDDTTPPPAEPPGGVWLALLIAGLALGGTEACGGVQDRPLTPDEKRAAAGAAYAAELQACVAKNSTSEGADLCAADVRSRWARTVPVAGGGAR